MGIAAEATTVEVETPVGPQTPAARAHATAVAVTVVKRLVKTTLPPAYSPLAAVLVRAELPGL